MGVHIVRGRVYPSLLAPGEPAMCLGWWLVHGVLQICDYVCTTAVYENAKRREMKNTGYARERKIPGNKPFLHLGDRMLLQPRDGRGVDCDERGGQHRPAVGPEGWQYEGHCQYQIGRVGIVVVFVFTARGDLCVSVFRRRGRIERRVRGRQRRSPLLFGRWQSESAAAFFFECHAGRFSPS